MLDISSTKTKEIYIQAELYRVLRDEEIYQRGIIPRGPVPSWFPKDVLIEATIRDNGSTTEADLVLLTKRARSGEQIEVKPALVIEIKTRAFSRLGQRYGSALKQAYNYATKIDCPAYAVYDGKNFILMQIAEPYLVGFTDFTLGREEKNEREIAGEIWFATRKLAVGNQDEPFTNPDLREHSDINPWRKAIPILIRQAFQRNARVSGWEPTKEQVKEKGEFLARNWFDMYDLKL